LLHHDKAPAHPSLLIRDFLTQHETTIVPQRPYSPDIAPADFFIFTKLKSVLKRRRLESVGEIEENSLVQLRSIPEEAFQGFFQKWKKRWEQCIKRRSGVIRRGQRQNSFKVSEKKIYLNCSKTLRTDLVHQESRGGLVGNSIFVFVDPDFKHQPGIQLN
jgi:transposase